MQKCKPFAAPEETQRLGGEHLHLQKAFWHIPFRREQTNDNSKKTAQYSFRETAPLYILKPEPFESSSHTINF